MKKIFLFVFSAALLMSCSTEKVTPVVETITTKPVTRVETYPANKEAILANLRYLYQEVIVDENYVPKGEGQFEFSEVYVFRAGDNVMIEQYFFSSKELYETNGPGCNLYSDAQAVPCLTSGSNCKTQTASDGWVWWILC